jgi:hypothetical protein
MIGQPQISQHNSLTRGQRFSRRPSGHGSYSFRPRVMNSVDVPLPAWDHRPRQPHDSIASRRSLETTPAVQAPERASWTENRASGAADWRGGAFELGSHFVNASIRLPRRKLILRTCPLIRMNPTKSQVYLCTVICSAHRLSLSVRQNGIPH